MERTRMNERLRTGVATSLVAAVIGATFALAGERPEPPPLAQVSSARPAQSARVVVYKTPTCSCCDAWVEYMRRSGFEVEGRNVRDDELTKRIRGSGVPDALSSCHAAFVGGYVVVGHVPASSIQRLLRSRPPDVLGIAVAGMPLGSPGMESGGEVEHYAVMAVRRKGRPMVFDRF